MNNLNQVLPKLMSQLRGQNTSGFNMLTNLMKNGGDPNAILKQMMGQLNPDVKQRILNQAKSYGCPDMFLSHLQNMK